MAKTLLEKLKGAKGWSANIRLPHDIKDADGTVIERVWIQPLCRKTQAELSEGGNADLSLRMLCRCVFDSEKGGDLVFSHADIPALKRELNHFMLNSLEMAMIDAGRPSASDAKEIIDAEKKD